MNDSSKKELFSLVADVMGFYRQDVTTFALNVWWQACRRFDFEQVSKALTAHVLDAERGQFAPKPADLVRQLEGTVTDRAMIAWGKAFDAMQRVGAYSDVVFDDPIIHAVVEDLGGWPKLCRGETKELSYLQHRFCESYRAYAGRPGFEYPRLLVGDRSSSDIYARRGLKAPAPAVIGERLQAIATYRNGQQGGKTSIALKVMAAIEGGQQVASEKHAGVA